MKGAKLLITGLENTGKTTLTSQLENAMVIAIDNKAYPYDLPHYEVREYDGIQDFRNTLVTKIKAYKQKFGKLPKTVVLDTVTKLYELIYLWAEENYKGFDVHNAISVDTLRLNGVLEKLLVDKGINLIVVAHVLFDQNTGRYTVPATGKFRDNGSWMSVVDEASFVHVLGNERYIAHKQLKYPCRSTIDMVESEPLNKYDINEHIRRLTDIADKKADNAL